MYNGSVVDNAVAAIRISSLKQGLQGDSPEAQREQIERFAQNHNIKIKKYFVFMESASKEQQPVQEAIDYCKNAHNDIQLFIIKSIDRFTRGGSYFYDHLKMQLVKYGIKLVDIYGVIGNQEVNTLEHLGLSYSWSVYSPTKKAEILEAERAKDEMRDIMTRMIGAEIRYVRLGYRVRQAPFGYVNEKVETSHGKRIILKPHPIEGEWIRKMFLMRINGTHTDEQIVDELNKLGYESRVRYWRNPKNRTQIIGERGLKKLNLKQLLKYLKRPVYAGINIEKWTNGIPIKAKFEGLVTIDEYNKANRGSIAIVEDGDQIKIWKPGNPRAGKKQMNNPLYPYKKYVMCPVCNKPLSGSASRGRLGNYYPGYHCNKRGHYFRVSQKKFDLIIENYVKNLHISPQYIDKLTDYVISSWTNKQSQLNKDKEIIETKIAELKASARAVADKIKFLNSPVAIKYMENDLVKTETEISQLQANVALQSKEETLDIQAVMATIRYFMEHLEELLLRSDNPLQRGAYFGLIFDHAPTYKELESGTPQLVPIIEEKTAFPMLCGTNGGFERSRTSDLFDVNEAL